MEILRCKMCGARLKVSNKSINPECEYCGAVYVLPWKQDDYTLAEQDEELAAQETEDKPEAVYLAEPIEEIDEEEARLQRIYDTAEVTMNGSGTEAAYKNAAKMFASISGFKDADELAEECTRLAEAAYINEAEKEERRKREEESEEERHYAQIEDYSNIRKRIRRVLSVVLILNVIVSLIVKCISMPYFQYGNAKKLMHEGHYMEAYSAFSQIADYKDSEDYLIKLRRTIEYSTLQYAETGSSVYFGVFEQDDNDKNGEELIEWEVYEKSGSKLLLISKKVLDYRQYHEKEESVTWENSSIRCWLNLQFLYNAFDDVEFSAILRTTLANNDKSGNGNDTIDKVFLLSRDEITQYYGNNSDYMIAEPTEYVQSRGNMSVEEEKRCDWWLRTLGEKEKCAVNVSSWGNLYLEGSKVTYRCGVRPAMWIDISELE